MSVDVVLTVLARLAVVGCGIASTIVTAWLFGEQGLGQYVVVVTFSQLAVQFSNLGIHSSNTYLAAGDPSLLRGLAANSLWVALVLGTAAAALLGLAGHVTGLIAVPTRLRLALGVALVPPTLYLLFGGSLLVAVRRFATFNLFQVGSNLLLLAGLIVAWKLRANVSQVLAVCVACWWLSAVVLHVLVARTGNGSWRFRPDLARVSFSFAGKAYVACLIGYFLPRANVFVLQILSGDAHVGYYSMAMRVADAMWILPSAIGLVLFPALVRRQQSRWELAWPLLVRVGVLMGAACLACALLIAPFVKLLPPSFAPSIQVVYWMLPGIFFYSLTSIVSQYLAASGFPAAVVGVWFVALGVLIAASATLVPRYQSVGAAMALSVANAAVFSMQLALALYMQAGESAGQPAAAPS